MIDIFLEDNFFLECTSQNDIKDSDNNTCENFYTYDLYTEFQPNENCGLYDTNEFIAEELCCGCGGGTLSGKLAGVDQSKNYTMSDFN